VGFRLGRPRIATCTSDHRGEPCRVCAAQRARRYRARRADRVAASEAQRAAAPERRSYVAARRLVLTALERGTITPSLRCDACMAREEEVSFLQPDIARPRLLVWLCASCYRYVRAIGGEIEARWVWPGPLRPKMTRRTLAFDREAHDLAVAAGHRLPDGAQRYRAYAESYLATIGEKPARAWLARGLHQGPDWTPTGFVDIDKLWRWFVAVWWQRERERFERELEAGEIVTLEPRPVREPSARVLRRVAPVVRSVPASGASVASLDASLAKLDEAQAEFDRRIAEILSRG
jgi:hypothetical protein